MTPPETQNDSQYELTNWTLPVSKRSSGHGTGKARHGCGDKKATPDHSPASLTSDRGLRGAPETHDLYTVCADVNPCWNERRPAAVKCVSLTARRSVGIDERNDSYPVTRWDYTPRLTNVGPVVDLAN